MWHISTRGRGRSQDHEGLGSGKVPPLVEFAYLDKESANGYGWPEVDITEELIHKLTGDFPEDFIEQVGQELDAEEGPWGLETTYRN